MKSQVTTHYGDEGMTRTLSGIRAPKHHPILEAAGDLDTFRSHLALLRLDLLEEAGRPHEEEAAFLWWLLHVCFLMGSAVSDPGRAHPEFRQGEIDEAYIQRLESEQMRLEEKVRLPHAFIVSASNRCAAEADIAATLARRFERRLTALKEAEPAFACAALLVFVNRLSDYLFILARYLDGGTYQTVDYSAAHP